VSTAGVPDHLPIAEHDAFLSPDVMALIVALEKPIFNYRMARGQLARVGYPMRLRKAEAEIREIVAGWVERDGKVRK
jgi:hypothetical protein